MFHYVGIDIAKHRHLVAVGNEQGDPCGKCRRFSNDEDGFAVLSGHLGELGVTPRDCIVAMESTGHCRIPVWSFLDGLGFDIAVVNPTLADAFRKAGTIRETEADAIDAFLIAEFARFKRLGPTKVSPEKSDEPEQPARCRSHLVKERTALKNKAIAAGDGLFPEPPRPTGGMQSATTRASLQTYASPEAVAATDIRTPAKTIREAGGGRFGREKAEEVKELAKHSVGTTFSERALSLQVRHIIDDIDYLDGEIAEIEKEASAILNETPSKLLLTIPGIGEVNGAAIAAEIGSAENFEGPKQLIAYAGLDSTKNQSGSFEGSREHMSKRGSPYLRYALMNAADVARQHDPYFGDYYDSLIARGKHHYVALSGVARKLGGVILAVLKEQRPYEKRPSVQSRQQAGGKVSP